jgi:hypothetical protein
VLLVERYQVDQAKESLVSSVKYPSAVGQKRTVTNAESIHLSRLNSSKVIGFLGHPLGEVITIEGIAADEEYTRRKADTGETLLRVQAVNGKSLKREAIFHFDPVQGADIKKPSAGIRFKYIGYETGGFSGLPEKAFDFIPRVQTKEYSFTTSFVILRDDKTSK